MREGEGEVEVKVKVEADDKRVRQRCEAMRAESRNRRSETREIGGWIIRQRQKSEGGMQKSE